MLNLGRVLPAALAIAGVAAQQCPSGYAPISGYGTSSTTTESSSASLISTSGGSSASSVSGSSTDISATSSTVTGQTGSTSGIQSTSSGQSETSTGTDTILTTATSSGTTDSSLSATSTSTSSTSTPTPITNATIDWVNCPSAKEKRLQCAYFRAPMDYTNPSAGTIDIPVVRVPADSSQATPLNQSIILNFGGPGESGVRGMADGAGTNIQSYIGYGYDMVSFDPRGVGLNGPYQCPELGGDSTDDNNMNSTGDFNSPAYPPSNFQPDSDAWFQNYFNLYSNHANQCASNAYNLAGQLVGTPFVARDIDGIARALGQDGYIRYYGFSYGTLLGATVAQMFPTRIERLVIDGNINPSDYYFGLGAEAVASFDNATAYFFNTCAAAGPTKCAFARDGVSGAELLNRYSNFYDSVRNGNRTIYNSTGGEVPYNNLLNTLSTLTKEGQTFFVNSAKTLNNYYTSAQPQNPNQKRQEPPAPTPSIFNPDSAPEDSGAAIDAVTCGDAITYGAVNGATFRGYQDFWKTYSKYGYESIISLIYTCGPWKVSAKQRPSPGDFSGVQTRNKILFVQGFYDPVTPYISAVNSSIGFVGSQIALHYGTGHCASRDPSSTLNAKIKFYFDSGNFSADISQISEPDSLPFGATTPVGRPQAMMKRSPSNIDHAARVGAQNLADMLVKGDYKRSEYPSFFADANARRDIYHILRQREQQAEIQRRENREVVPIFPEATRTATPTPFIVIPPYCTAIGPIVGSTSSSTIVSTFTSTVAPSSTSSGSTTSASSSVSYATSSSMSTSSGTASVGPIIGSTSSSSQSWIWSNTKTYSNTITTWTSMPSGHGWGPQPTTVTITKSACKEQGGWCYNKPVPTDGTVIVYVSACDDPDAPCHHGQGGDDSHNGWGINGGHGGNGANDNGHGGWGGNGQSGNGNGHGGWDNNGNGNGNGNGNNAGHGGPGGNGNDWNGAGKPVANGHGQGSGADNGSPVNGGHGGAGWANNDGKPVANGQGGAGGNGNGWDNGGKPVASGQGGAGDANGNGNGWSNGGKPVADGQGGAGAAGGNGNGNGNDQNGGGKPVANGQGAGGNAGGDAAASGHGWESGTGVGSTTGQSGIKPYTGSASTLGVSSLLVVAGLMLRLL